MAQPTPGGGAAASSSEWNQDATYFGYVESTHDALIIFQATRLGILKRWSRRMDDSERERLVKSGNIFVYGETESGIKRW
ncbi:Gti1/Pac2 family-domain-containing protein [Zopfochytrium polystomum]|nr:Gti1/Pac2 family-domain-containing protein [Zopfochytrium polystomum]